MLENLPQVLKDKFELDTEIAESLWIAFVYRKAGFVPLKPFALFSFLAKGKASCWDVFNPLTSFGN